MILSFHGGQCCGIKHIHGFESSPKDIEYEKEKTPKYDHDQNGDEVESGMDFFYDAAPEETAEARLDRMLAFCDKHRPNGIIEVCLVNFSWNPVLDNWRPVLEARGFKEINNCYNSNSGNRVYVFHRTKDVS